ncbi:hypothetical protein ACMHYO_14650 [Allopusillimonas ginsengisoli]|uniref:hypothetical protein n=1 Tax=Allopusillimonas ginsengisoli TaxID=453575 RepID=UPI0026D1624C
METQNTLEELLLTGAGGGLGRILRTKLKPFSRALRLSDITPVDAGANGEAVICDLSSLGLQTPAAVATVIAMVINVGAFSSGINQWIKTSLENGSLNTIYKQYHGNDPSPAVIKGQ